MDCLVGNSERDAGPLMRLRCLPLRKGRLTGPYEIASLEGKARSSGDVVR